MCKKFLISGRVQGVCFRAFTREQAQTLNLTGYAKNLPDGRVEVVACGEIAKIQQLLDWLWHGPPQAQVAQIETQTYNEFSGTDFSVI